MRHGNMLLLAKIMPALTWNRFGMVLVEGHVY